MKNRIALSAALVACATLATDAETLTWTGGGDGASFADVANWAGTPTGGAIDIAALVDDFVIADPAATVGGTGGVAQLSWVSGSGSLSMSAGTLNGATGLRFTTLDLSGGVMTRQFFLEVTATVSGTAELRLNGGGNPLNLATIEVVGTEARVVFVNETPDDFRGEHAGKMTFDGLPAIEGVTYEVVADGGSGCVVRSLGGTFEPQTLTWNGVGGDGTSFIDLGNWDGTPTGGVIDADFLVDHYLLEDGIIGDDLDGEEGFGVRQLYFYGDGDFTVDGVMVLEDLSTAGAVTQGGGSFIADATLRFLNVDYQLGAGTFTMNADVPFRIENREELEIFELDLFEDLFVGINELKENSSWRRYETGDELSYDSFGYAYSPQLDGVVRFQTNSVVYLNTFTQNPVDGFVAVRGTGGTFVEVQSQGGIGCTFPGFPLPCQFDVRVEEDGQEGFESVQVVPASGFLPQ